MIFKPRAGSEVGHRHSKDRGTHFERRVRAYLTRKGWKVFRSAGSMTFADLIALKPGPNKTTKALTVQCKASEEPNLKPEERAGLLDAYNRLNTQVLVICRNSTNNALIYYAIISGDFVQIKEPRWL